VPKLIVVRGLSGTGKTTLADRLHRDTAIVCLVKDHFKAFLLDSYGLGDAAWQKTIGFSASQMMYLLAGELLDSGHNVLLDNPTVTKHAVADVQRLHQEHPSDVLEIVCVTDEVVREQRCHDRITQGSRHPGFHEQDLAFLSGRLQQDEGVGFEGYIGLGQAITVDTTHFGDDDYQLLLSKVRRFLEESA
jgi:predicted kinase